MPARSPAYTYISIYIYIYIYIYICIYVYVSPCPCASFASPWWRLDARYAADSILLRASAFCGGGKSKWICEGVIVDTVGRWAVWSAVTFRAMLMPTWLEGEGEGEGRGGEGGGDRQTRPAASGTEEQPFILPNKPRCANDARSPDLQLAHRCIGTHTLSLPPLSLHTCMKRCMCLRMMRDLQPGEACASLCR